MERRNAIFNDTLAIACVLVAGMHVFATNAKASFAISEQKPIFIVIGLCIAAYLVLCKTEIMRKRAFTYVLMLSALSVSVFSLFFFRGPNPQIFGVRMPLSYFLIFTYFIVMQNENGSDRLMAEHVFMSLAFSMALALSPDVQGFVFFTLFVIHYGLFNSGRSFLKVICHQAVSVAAGVLAALSNPDISRCCAMQIRSAFMAPDWPIADEMFGTFGTIGVVFAFVILCLLVYAYARTRANLTFFTYLAGMLSIAVLASVFKVGRIEFMFLPNDAVSLVLDSLLLAHMGHMPKRKAVQAE